MNDTAVRRTIWRCDAVCLVLDGGRRLRTLRIERVWHGRGHRAYWRWVHDPKVRAQRVHPESGKHRVIPRQAAAL